MTELKRDVVFLSHRMGQLKHLNGNKAFNHYAPSRYMMAHIGELQFSDNTLNAFEEAFKAINKLPK